MTSRSVLVASLLGLLASPATAGRPMKQEDSLTEVDAKRLKVTQGKLEPLPNGCMVIEEPKVRAVLEPAPPQEAPKTRSQKQRSLMSSAAKLETEARIAELRFTYLGATSEQVPLASGEMRRQIGLKLRAQDGCNVVYVMWRILPKPGLVVSVKNNPEMHRSDDCGNGGYQTVKPSTKSAVPELEPGQSHTLRAELQGAELKVLVDGKSVWEGTLPPEALTFDGPVGLRSDNGRFQVELLSTP